MSKIQGDRSKRTNIIAGAITAAALVGVLGGIGAVAVKANADAEAHTALMVEVKADGRTLNAAAAEDTALAATVVEAGQIAHLQAVAAEQVAVKVAAEQAAAAEAARVAAEQAAAQDPARQQTVRQQAATGDPAPSGPIKCPAGSQANSGDGPNDTSCFPTICFHIQLPDAAHPECEVAFKP
jgi:preprotein translocase subunit SecF